MSVTSTYTFFQGFFNGLCTVHNVAEAGNPGFFKTFPNSSTMVMHHRPDNEHTIDLGKLINTNEHVGLVSKLLMSAKAMMKSDLRVQAVPWMNVPYFLQSAGAHLPTDMLLKVSFDYQIETPIICTDIDGTISVFLFLFIDANKKLQVKLDGVWFTLDGGYPFGCHDAGVAGIKAAMPIVKEKVLSMLPGLLAVTKDVKFSTMYYLPGNGSKTPGIQVDNASVNTGLGLIPA
ncbi:hypothetical protein CSQ96_07340 [Janthinobacterium sp. BJB412]|nr:hypothetical protein CSQ96_07340 [Janthinobacterium sp. BJB412]